MLSNTGSDVSNPATVNPWASPQTLLPRRLRGVHPASGPNPYMPDRFSPYPSSNIILPKSETGGNRDDENNVPRGRKVAAESYLDVDATGVYLSTPESPMSLDDLSELTVRARVIRARELHQGSLEYCHWSHLLWYT